MQSCAAGSASIRKEGPGTPGIPPMPCADTHPWLPRGLQGHEGRPRLQWALRASVQLIGLLAINAVLDLARPRPIMVITLESREWHAATQQAGRRAAR